MYSRYGKRIFDLCFSTVAIIVSLPFFAILALFLWVVQKENPFFLQERVGKDYKIFKIIKFRTMTSEKSRSGELLSDDERTTVVGHWFRENSIDEVPQLWNVFRGEMSLVGPRPLPYEDLSLCSGAELQRYSVLPGITGWAQINGRNEITFKKRSSYDLWYLKNSSFICDLNILNKTLKMVIFSKGVISETEAFNGTN